MSERPRLRAGIIGAGIAGLSAAIALRRAGWHVEVYEKSLFKNEVGAAIVVGCNATRVLRRWGADFEAWDATDNMQVRMPKGDTLEPALTDSFADVSSEYGERWLFFLRIDLHKGLRQMAEDSGLTDAPPAEIHLGCEVVEMDCDAGTFQLRDGREIKKDLVVIASGIHCSFVENVVGMSNPVIATGKAVYRCMVPMSKVLSDPLTAPLFENEAPGLLGPNLPAFDTLCASYPCRNNTLLNIAYVRPMKTEMVGERDWNLPASIDDVLEAIKPFHPAVQALPKKADDIKAHNLMLRKEIPRFVKGRAVLVGDAAHPMLTYQAQGGSMAIESMGALEVFFQDVHKSADVPGRLQLFDRFRHPRCVTTQIMSNVPRGPQNYPELVERVRKFYDGPLPPATSKPWSKNFRDFFFSYDVFEESERYLKNTRSQC